MKSLENHLRLKQFPVLQALVLDFGSLHIQYDENISISNKNRATKIQISLCSNGNLINITVMVSKEEAQKEN